MTEKIRVPLSKPWIDDLLRERDELRERLAAAERSAREMHIAADRFARERDELRAEVADLLPRMDADAMRITTLVREAERLRALLQRIYEWDHLDSAADGPFWRSQIDKALGNA